MAVATGEQTGRLLACTLLLSLRNKKGDLFIVSQEQHYSAAVRLPSLPQSDARVSLLTAKGITSVANMGAKIQTILAPTDLCDASKAGVRYALEAARDLDARVIIYHVITGKEIAEFGRKRQAGAFVAPRFNGLLEIQEMRLRRFLKRNFAHDLKSNKVKLKVEFGAPEKEIIATAKSAGADVIIMSSGRASRFVKLILGSVTERIVRNAPCPVLAIPADLPGVDKNASTRRRQAGAIGSLTPGRPSDV